MGAVLYLGLKKGLLFRELPIYSPEHLPTKLLFTREVPSKPRVHQLLEPLVTALLLS